MKIHLNAGQTGSYLFNAARINASVARQNSAISGSTGKGRDCDRTAFSLQGKLAGMIDRITEQKQSIFERRDELIENTLKRGGDLDDIKDQLKDYENQLKDMDDQIEDLYARQLKEAVSQDGEEKKGQDKSVKDKSEGQLETERMVNIACSADGVKETEKIAAVRNRVQGDIHVKQGELGQSGREVQYLELRGMDMGEGYPRINTGDMIKTLQESMEHKETEISGLQDKFTQIGIIQGKSMKESLEEVEDNWEGKDEEPEDEVNKPEDV